MYVYTMKRTENNTMRKDKAALMVVCAIIVLTTAYADIMIQPSTDTETFRGRTDDTGFYIHICNDHGFYDKKATGVCLDG